MVEAIIDGLLSEEYQIGEPIGKCNAVVKRESKDGIEVEAYPSVKKCQECPFGEEYCTQSVKSD